MKNNGFPFECASEESMVLDALNECEFWQSPPPWEEPKRPRRGILILRKQSLRTGYLDTIRGYTVYTIDGQNDPFFSNWQWTMRPAQNRYDPPDPKRTIYDWLKENKYWRSMTPDWLYERIKTL